MTQAAPASPTTRSRIHRFQQDYRWAGVPLAEYKAPSSNWCGIQRMVLAGDKGESIGFQVRYFEIEPGGYSSLESHAHEHVVIVFRGAGEVQLGEQSYPVSYGDTVYVAPHELHQLRNPASEPFGFFCMIDANRKVLTPPTPPS